MKVRCVDPMSCDPPHKVTHPEKFDELVREFSTKGWDINCPNLIGYDFDGRTQLISGSHRWAAAKVAKIQIPVEIHSYEYVHSIWGTDQWMKLLNNESNL